jgi:hypothetical protein
MFLLASVKSQIFVCNNDSVMRLVISDRQLLTLSIFMILFSIVVLDSKIQQTFGQSDPPKMVQEIMQQNIEKYLELGEESFIEDCVNGGVGEYTCQRVAEITRQEVEASKQNQSSNSLSNPEDIIYETYTNNHLGYSVEYPNDWQVLFGDIVKGTREFTVQLYNDSRLSLLDTDDFAEIILEGYQEDNDVEGTGNFGEINIDGESAKTFSYTENNKETMVAALMHENVPYLFKYETLEENFERDADTMLRFFHQ